MTRFNKFACSALAFALLAVAGAANAAYPEKQITLVVPFAPGGANDAVGRIVAQELSKELRQSIVIDNRGGAGGMLGTEYVANAAPDGYTLLLISAAHAINGSIHSKMRYDPVTSFTPVSQLTNAAYVLVVNKDLPAKTMSDLIALGKSQPGRLNYASSGIGSAPHLAGIMFSKMAGVDIMHVPYKGGGPAMVDLLRGDVSMYFSSLSSAMTHLRANNIRALGVTTTTRVAALPNTPSMSEAGLPGYELPGWYGLVAPAKTPTAIVSQLNDALAKVLANPKVRAQLTEQGEEPVGSKAEDFAKLIKAEVDKYAKIVRDAKILAD
jgi:tripartite-type tricarboxylate transporter receptor subunit TctC